MQEQDTPRRGGAAFIWQWGGIVGAILALVQLTISLFSLGLFKTILDVLVWLTGFFAIGLFAARHTGRVKTGVQAGLVTGLISGLVGAIFSIMQLVNDGIQLTPAVNQALQKAQQQGRTISASQLQTIVLIGIIISLIVTLIVELGLGAGIGALGGLVGHRQATPIASPPEGSDQI